MLYMCTAGKRGGKSKADKTQAHDKGAEELLNGKTKHKDKTKVRRFVFCA